MMKKAIVLIHSFILIFILLFSNFSLPVQAQDDPMIIVSLGDSYSSGEGVEPFYGQTKKLEQKVYDQDWIAHRSTMSWPALLSVPGRETGIMRDYRQTEESDAPCQWYFAAASGAVSKEVWNVPQQKEIYKKGGLFKADIDYTAELPVQTRIFDKIRGSVDYVTMTIGGNDAKFTDICLAAAGDSWTLGWCGTLEKSLNEVWGNVDNIMADLEKTYKYVTDAAGRQATLIVVGYPELFDDNMKGAIFSTQARMVNEKVRDFNDKIEQTVYKCKTQGGMNIEFVDVEEAFRGHQAGSRDPWINDIYVTCNSQDINERKFSAYSLHPNSDGIVAYATAVNNMIEHLESLKKYGTLAGNVRQANNRVPVSGAVVNATVENSSESSREYTNDEGNYSIKLNEGSYKVEINAPGFVPFLAYANVTGQDVTYMETFLLVAGQEGEQGTAQGTIINGVTGAGVPQANIAVRKGWNNTTRGEILARTTSDSYGNYSLTLPLGNYTLEITKDGFVNGTANIYVQKGITTNLNGTLSPNGEGTDFRIILSWGENPRDLDSHVVGNKSDGGQFHVYYGDKSSYDNSVEICNLDVDDTTSYGPETITLKATESTPYYYYIHHFAGSGSISTSEAMIQVYRGTELIRKFNVPTDQGTEIYWNVFAIINGQLIERNTITSQPDTSYAGNTITSSLRSVSLRSSMVDKLLDLESKTDEKISDDVLDTTEDKELISEDEEKKDSEDEMNNETSEEAISDDKESSELIPGSDESKDPEETESDKTDNQDDAVNEEDSSSESTAPTETTSPSLDMPESGNANEPENDGSEETDNMNDSEDTVESSAEPDAPVESSSPTLVMP